MKIRAPFYVQEIENTKQTQATSMAWTLCAYGQRSLPVFEGSKTKLATLWGYWRQSYLGSMLLSLPSHTYTWRQS